MPELPVTVNANITRIDAPFPEQWREQLFQFSKGIDEIKQLMTVMAVGLTETKDAEEAMVKLYSAESLAERASIASQMEQREQGRPVNEQGQETGASRGGGEAFHSPLPPGSLGYKRAQQEWREEQESSGGSRPPDAPETSQEFLKKNPIDMVQHYGGRYTATDLLNLMAQGTDKAAGGSEEGFWGGATGHLVSASRDYLPRLQAAYQLSHISEAKGMSENLGSYAGSLGYQPGNGALGITNSVSGPFGTNFRIPLLNSAALSGISQTAGAYETAMQYPGLSGTQVMGMNQSLAERGWFPGQKGQQELFDAQAHLISKGGAFQQLGENPATAEMLDEGTRNGNASMEEMISTIEEIPDAAEKAHEGIAQFQATMREMGTYNESIGGTKIEGQQQAKLLSESTGMPIQAVKGIIESPYTSSAIFRETGVPSWEQGQVPAAVKNEIGMKEFWRLAQQVGPGEARTYTTADGVKIHRSAKESQAARMHLINPSVSYESALRMLREGKTGSEGRGRISADLEGWKQHFDEISGHGKEGQENELLRGTKVIDHGEGFNFGGILHNMAQLKTAQGERMFNQEDLKNIRTNKGEGYSGHGKTLAEEKYKEVQNVINEKAGKDSNAAGSPGQVVIELSSWAKKVLQLPNKKTRIKAEAGAGENSNVNTSAGYTDSLYPRGYYGGGR
jgi:hypothetical protein